MRRTSPGPDSRKSSGKLFALGALLACLALPRPALARGLGLGVIFGEPTGLVGKLWQGDRAAYDLGLAYSFNEFMLIYADYLFEYPNGLGRSSRIVAQMVPYWGVGGIFFLSTGRFTRNKAYFDSSAGVGVRVPLGIEWLPPEVPLGIFIEITPGVGIIPAVFGFIQGGLGARFYFN